MGIIGGPASFLQRWRLGLRRRRLAGQGHVVSTYRYSLEKPPVVSARPIELFYRPRTLWIVLQLLALAALAMWTFKNYVTVFKSLS